MSKQYYTLKVAGLTRELPLCPVNEKLDIAAFVMFSDVELTIVSATELLKRVPEFDVIITAESKGIPLAYEMSRQSGKPYVLARKSIKVYMVEPVKVDVKSISTKEMQSLYLDKDYLELINNKKILIVDDVISTGDSLLALEKLVEIAGGHTVCKATVLAEGEAAERKDILFLEKLPLFFK